MPIGPGEDWGHRDPLPDSGVIVEGDAEANTVVTTARRAGQPIPVLGLVGGDLCRTVGGRGDRARLQGDRAVTLPCDLGAALLDGHLHWFVSHLVMRQSWLRGPIVAVMNAGHRGRWEIAPRAHPGDGRLDVVEADLGLVDRFKAWRRLPSGSHVPHPSIAVRRTDAVQFEFARPFQVEIDGTAAGTVRRVSVRVEPDALQVVV